MQRFEGALALAPGLHVVAALGLLAGSPGGRDDSKDLVRRVLFVAEET